LHLPCVGYWVFKDKSLRLIVQVLGTGHKYLWDEVADGLRGWNEKTVSEL